MTKQRRGRVWVVAGALALVAIASGVSRAQEVPPPASGPMGDVFENNSNSPVYEDQYSESCDSANHSTPYVDGYNAALCFKSPLAPGYTQCPPIGGGETFLAGKSGNFCVYCQQPPMGLTGPAIVIPINGGGGVTAPNRYNYTCAGNLADPLCYLSCFGKFQYTPPPGTALMGQDGTPPSVPPSPAQNQPTSRPPLQGYVSNTEPDPCHPAGPKNYYVCDYPNLPRPAGCTCNKPPPPNTPPQPGTQPAQKPTQEPTDKESTQTPDPGNYLLGLVAGMLDCPKGVAQGLGTIVAGAGYFGQGDFVNAAQTWGLAPGQSVALKVIYAELTTPQVNVVSNGSTSYSQGVIAGRRICGYVIVPAGIKTVGNVLKGGATAATTAKGGGPSRSGGPSGEGGPSKGPGAPEGGTPPEDTTKVTTPPKASPQLRRKTLPELRILLPRTNLHLRQKTLRELRIRLKPAQHRKLPPSHRRPGPVRLRAIPLRACRCW